MSTAPQVGEIYTRTQTFTVDQVDPNLKTVDLITDDGDIVTKKWAFLSTLQKTAAPVAVFQPGDTVIRLSDGAVFAIGNRGYFDHTTGEFVKSDGVFTSTSFRKAVIE